MWLNRVHLTKRSNKSYSLYAHLFLLFDSVIYLSLRQHLAYYEVCIVEAGEAGS